MVAEPNVPERKPSPGCYCGGSCIPPPAIKIVVGVPAEEPKPENDDPTSVAPTSSWRPTEHIPGSQRWFPAGR
ncbi:hypothetical protein COT78_00570 [Candidatus Berkelbacteria bacterium CG10_big_fil_rev_8_21_14_0_10_43_13]|uniref:Uncharacterized protein n=1 Tax=Candidatus Berkelbacteria bacterium CG10_big_fil_rev_8_21_14_0_10_43_13 TaxID=1974514 RepID=A0A2H0W787_9BACT|nr:MAG: hypothetical protein COT78_00570 [Candidatus Berkelbacteria bacterium CG10_big_fil_rev_8_21_14_0_10_43_13]